MNVAAAPTPWIGRPPAARGVVAGVRRRTSARERRLARQVGLGAAGALAIALLLVWIRLQVVHTGYELSTARQLEHKLEQEQRELALEIATLTSPRRLEELARERLGMRPPAPGQVVSPP
jgi:cell division protein FtsL